MNIFDEENYKQILKKSILSKKETLGKPFTFQKLADACRVQKTYLSKILNHDGDLDRDQLYLACKFLGFTDSELTFTTYLYEYDRTQIADRRRDLRAKLDAFKQQMKKTESHIQHRAGASHTDKELVQYYLDPYYKLVHMFLSVKRFKQDIGGIAKTLKISKDKVTAILRNLEQMGLIEFREKNYEIKKDFLHLSADSPIMTTYRKAIRLKAMERMDQEPESAQPYTFSVVFSATKETQGQIQHLFFEFLNAMQPLVEKAEAEDVFQLNFDLLSWT
ncbi:MAG: DUF4423 domain-containing protein [Oligoflexales bacterium]